MSQVPWQTFSGQMSPMGFGFPDPGEIFGGGGGGFPTPPSFPDMGEIFGGGSGFPGGGGGGNSGGGGLEFPDSGGRTGLPSGQNTEDLVNWMYRAGGYPFDEAVRDPWSPKTMMTVQPISRIGARNMGPWEEQAQYLADLFNRAGMQVGEGPNQLTTIGQDWRVQNALSSGPLMQMLGGGALGNYAGGGATLNRGASGLDFLLNPALLSPDSNPYLAATGTAATRPLYRNLVEQILPNIRSEAGGAGQYGSTRQGIAEGLAAGRTQDAASDALAKIYSGGYGQGLGAMSNALGQAGGLGSAFGNLAQGGTNLGTSLLGMYDTPATSLMSVGQMRQQYPWEQLSNYQKALAGQYGQSGMYYETDPGYKVAEVVNNIIRSWVGGGQAGSAMGGGA